MSIQSIERQIKLDLVKKIFRSTDLYTYDIDNAPSESCEYWNSDFQQWRKMTSSHAGYITRTPISIECPQCNYAGIDIIKNNVTCGHCDFRASVDFCKKLSSGSAEGK